MLSRVLLLAAAVAAAVLCQTVVRVDAANILLMPFFNASHFLEMDGVGRPLVERGHNVYCMFDNLTAMPKGAPYKLVTHHTIRQLSMIHDPKFKHSFVENSKKGLNFTFFEEMTKYLCVNLLTDPDLFSRVESLQIDMFLIDGMAPICYFLLPYRLNKPFITVGSGLSSWSSRVPLLPSATEPTVGLDIFGLHFCEETETQWGIVRRLCRIAAFVIPQILFGNTGGVEYLLEYVDFPLPPVHELQNNASLALVNSGYLLSSPLPKTPNVEYVGGLTTRPPKPLEPSLEAWMAESPNVVLVSFGSTIGSLPFSIARKFFEAFGRLSEYRFLWRFAIDESKQHKIASNIRVMDWLPQNDALGHKSTRLFITHSGNNGQQEALYHGVPMLCFYVQADQMTNARRVTKRGFGKMLSLHDVTVDQLVDAVNQLVNNSTYRVAIGKASRIFHSEKHPSERAADAVEHVLRFGADHLRPHEAYSLSLWEYYMIDIGAAIYGSVLVTLWVMYKATRAVVVWIAALFCKKSRRNEAEARSKSKAE